MAIVMQHRFESAEQSPAPIAPRSRLVIEDLSNVQGVALFTLTGAGQADSGRRAIAVGELSA